MKTVSAQMTVNEAVLQCPEALRIFSLVGIDTCCGGALPIGEAARRHAVDADNLIAAINSLDCTDEASEVSMCSL